VTRAIQRTVARALIAALLFAQMMVAAYACPAISPEGAAKGMHAVSYPVVAFSDAAPQTAGMPDGCDGMAFDSANLCAAHCQAGDQNIDPGQAIAVPANPFSSFYVVQVPSASSSLDRNSIPSEFANAIPPPHAILHCCFRI